MRDMHMKSREAALGFAIAAWSFGSQAGGKLVVYECTLLHVPCTPAKCSAATTNKQGSWLAAAGCRTAPYLFDCTPDHYGTLRREGGALSSERMLERSDMTDLFLGVC